MSEWMRVSVCEIGTHRRTPLSLPPLWPHRRAPSPDSSSALHVWKWKSIMPFTRLPALRATAIYIFPTLSQPLHVINLPPAERGRSGWQTTRKAIFISSLQPPNCRLAFIQFSPAPSLSLPLSLLSLAEFGCERGMG